MMNNIPVPQQIYRHFKGNLYQIISLAEHTESNEQLVIYQALYGDFKVYARPLSMFMEKVDRIKYPDAAQEYRFEPVVMKEKPNDSVIEVLPKEREISEKTEALEKSDMPEEAEISEQEEEAEVLNIDPLVLEFLDARSYEERLNILAALHHRITDDMINTMAIAVDIEIKEGDIEDRYAELRRCLLLYDKFECSRLR
ncbi:MAG: DUF1653 domain-containing protein [Lachnospiraceae bacterium]|nr:DUF1653 domain-containing protein [Lachnospiraceae bacterium]